MKTIILSLLSFSLIATGGEKPNIVVIMADDLGWMDLHCYGNEKLDAWLKETDARMPVRAPVD